MTKRSVRKLLIDKKRVEEKALSPAMRDLMVSFEAQYGHRDPEDPSRSKPQEPDRR